VKLWAQAVHRACYILNRTPTLRTKDSTPYEIWMGKKPSLAHTRIFGSEVFVHVPKEQRSKWDKKSKKMIFVGYQQDSLNYRLYDPHTAKIIVSRDVKFNKSKDKATLTNDGVSLPLDGNSQQRDSGNSSPVEQLESNEEYESTEEESQREEVQERLLRNRNTIRKPNRYEANLVELSEPTTYQEAISGKNADKWNKAIEEELEAHKRNGTWRLTFLL